MPTQIKFRGVVPPTIKVKEMRFALLNGLRKVRTQMLLGFHMTTESWEHQPVFVGSDPSLAGGVPAISVETDDDIYTLVNEGARVHAIYPRGDYPLFFHSEYGTKTAPGVIDSFEGGPGEKDTFAAYINKPGISHPGFKARKFDEAIKETLQPYFLQVMEEAMEEAARKSGWGK